MAQSYLIFDFGTNEEVAQQARHRLEGWRQAFRLDKKLQLKFERTAPEKPIGGEQPAEKGKSRKSRSDRGEQPTEKGESPESRPDGDEHIRLLVRLDFSDHERLSYHRWLERIPAETPFKDAAPQVLRPGDAGFNKTADLFDSLP